MLVTGKKLVPRLDPRDATFVAGDDDFAAALDGDAGFGAGTAVLGASVLFEENFADSAGQHAAAHASDDADHLEIRLFEHVVVAEHDTGEEVEDDASTDDAAEGREREGGEGDKG